MIRKATAQDIDSISAIYSRIHDDEEAGRATTGWLRSTYPTKQTALDALARDDLFVFECNGTIAASAIINQLQVPEYINCPWKYEASDREVLVLHTLTVDPCSKGQGIGRSFVSFYENCGKEMGCTVLRMDTNARNIAARNLYAKLGYEEPGFISCIFNGIPDVLLVCLEKKLPQDNC